MHKFMVHEKGDDVGVATEDIREREDVTGVYMDTGETLQVEARGDIPLSHKIALSDITKADEVIEYGTRIGVATQAISVGEYVHTHNIRSARWSFEQDGRLKTQKHKKER